MTVPDAILLGRGVRTPYERDATIDALFRRHAAVHPEGTALLADDARVTYGELDERSDSLANRLRGAGVAEGETVGVALERGTNFIVALLGALKAGAVYLPLDVDYPASRTELMLRDSGARTIVTTEALASRLPTGDRTMVRLESDAAHIGSRRSAPVIHKATATSAAYVMYTSGSTGTPKGVAVSHRGVVRLVRNTDYVHLGPDQTLLHAAPGTFDASTFEIWGALLNGARLVLAPAHPLSIGDLRALIDRHGVTTMFLTPAHFARIVDLAWLPLTSLRQLIVGGDVLPSAQACRFLERHPACRLINGYGPTENTTFSTAFTVTPDARGDIPIGRPIANAVAYVLKDDLVPAGVGREGELYVGGDGVALGYVNRPELTSERFIPDPFAEDKGARLYRTGDRALLRADGVLEFRGRRDAQVKIRGFRVELGEVEAALRAHPRVADAIAVVVGDGADKTLVVYAVPACGAGLDEASLRAHLAATLPLHMTPARIELLDELPHHRSGKVDRAALAAVSRDGDVVATHHARRDGAVRPVEEAIAELWREVLPRDATFGRDQNFFDAGGDSLRLLALHTRLEQRLRVRVSLMDLFRHATIRKLATTLEAAQ